jgi:hypothetical protein
MWGRGMFLSCVDVVCVLLKKRTQREKVITYLQANRTHITSTQGKIKTYLSAIYEHKTHILIKNVFTFRTKKNPKEIHQ